MSQTVAQPLPDLLTVDETAEVLRLSKGATLALVHRGDLKASRLGKVYRVPREELLACLRRLERPQPPGAAGGGAAT